MDKFEWNFEATSFRRSLGEDCYSPIDIFNLVSTIEDMSILFYPFGQRISGLCKKVSDHKLIAINSNSVYGRQRFTLAHELCHLYIHDMNMVVCDYNLSNLKDEKEYEANMFASYFLLPIEAFNEYRAKNFKDKSKVTIDDIVKMEQHYQISRKALLIRLSEENLIEKKDIEQFSKNVKKSAWERGYDLKLYEPNPENKKKFTIGEYVRNASFIKEKKLLPESRIKTILINAYRDDIYYDEFEGDEEDE